MKVKKLGQVLKPTKLKFENRAVLNPAIWQEGEHIHMFYRAIDEEFRSSIGYAKLCGPKKVIERSTSPVLKRDYEYERAGVEDPRIVKIDDTFYLFYVAHDGKNALTAYATSTDLKVFKKRGIISPKMTYKKAERLFEQSNVKDGYHLFSSYYQKNAGEDVLLWEKDMFLFPRKIHNRFAMLHRVLPDIQIIFFDNFKQLKTQGFWERQLRNLSKNVVIENTHWFGSRNIGGGCPPLETKQGWLLIYHTVEERNTGRVYHAGAALLDIDNPQKAKRHLHNNPLFSPTKRWEKYGEVPNIVFPTGTAVFGEDIYIYYGAADSSVAVASVNIEDLIDAMEPSHHK